MFNIYLKAVSIIAPGIKDWLQANKIFTGNEKYIYQKVDKKLNSLLPPNERRRASRVIQLGLSAIQQMVDNHAKPIDFDKLSYVFTSCNGDLNIFHQISCALTMKGRPVSPTKFHNSVHNAPAGYCAIALNSQSESTSISGFKDSATHGLLEAFVQVSILKKDCLLTGYDEIPPEPLLSIFPISDDFSFSLLLSSNKKDSICRLSYSLDKISFNNKKTNDSISDHQLTALMACNPQAQIIPLLRAIACKQNVTTNLSYQNMNLSITTDHFI